MNCQFFTRLKEHKRFKQYKLIIKSMHLDNMFQPQPFANIKETMQKLMRTCQVQIFYQHPNEQSLGYGSGYLITDNLILTPAHNVYDKIQKIYHVNIQIQFPAGSKQRFSCQAENIYVSQRFKQEKKSKHLLYDYALLKIEKNIVNARLQACKCLFGSNMIEIYNIMTVINLKQKIIQLQLSNQNKDKTIKGLEIVIETMKMEIQDLKADKLNDSFTSCKSQQCQKHQQLIIPQNNSRYLTQFISYSLKFQNNIFKRVSRKDKESIKSVQKQIIIGLKPINKSVDFKVLNYGGIYALAFGIIPQSNIEQLYDKQLQKVNTIYLRCDPRPSDLDGCIYVNGVNKTDFQTQFFINPHSVLKMKLQGKKICLIRDEKQIFEIDIPQEFQKSKIFPFFISHCSGDQIQFIFND